MTLVKKELFVEGNFSFTPIHLALEIILRYKVTSSGESYYSYKIDMQIKIKKL